MKYLASLLCLLFVPLSLNAEQPERKVIKPPTTARPQSSQERRVVAPPPTVKPQLPQGFGRPVQRPPGFGKQQWQKPQQQQPQQQQQVRPSHNYRHGSVIIGRPYVHPFNYPSVETRYHPIYGFYRVYHPPVINPYYNPPVIVHPQPFSGLFFHFRF